MHRALRVMKDILDAKRDGAVLIVVDPKKTETASAADMHISIRPGTDTAFVLSLINEIISKGWYDMEFVQKYTTGFAELGSVITSYSIHYTKLYDSAVTGHFGEFHGLINNAGVAPEQRLDLLSLTEESLDRLNSINLKGPLS